MKPTTQGLFAGVSVACLATGLSAETLRWGGSRDIFSLAPYSYGDSYTIMRGWMPRTTMGGMRKHVQKAHRGGIGNAVCRTGRDKRDRARTDKVGQQPIAVFGGQCVKVEIQGHAFAAARLTMPPPLALAIG